MESHETAEHFHIALTIQAAKPVKADSLGKKSIKSKKREPKGSFLFCFRFAHLCISNKARLFIKSQSKIPA